MVDARIKSQEIGAEGAAKVPVRRYPVRIHVHCRACGHQGVPKVFLDRPLRLVCKKCGKRDYYVAERDTMRKLKDKKPRPEPSYGTAFSS